MPVGDVYQSNLWSTFQGDHANVWTAFFRADTLPDTLTVEEDLNEFMENVMVAAFKSVVRDTFIFECSDTSKIWDELTDLVSTSLPRQRAFNVPGTILTGNTLPGQCSLLIQLLSDLESSNPMSRGRDFFNGLLAADQLDGVWALGPVAIIQAIYKSNLIDGVSTTDNGVYTYVNFSRKAASDPAILGSPVRPIIAIRSLKHVRTQRRRQPMNPCDKYFDLVT